jgi:hypothetical protein
LSSRVGLCLWRDQLCRCSIANGLKVPKSSTQRCI